MPENTEFSPLSLVPPALLILRQVMEFVAAERARSGMTYEEIFDAAGVKIDANSVALIADLAKYDGAPLPI